MLTRERDMYTMLFYFYETDKDDETRFAQAVHANAQQAQSLAAKLSEN